MTCVDCEHGAPIKVHVTHDDTKPTAPQASFRDVISKTYLASAVTPENVLGRSQARREHTIAVMGVVPTNSMILLADNEADAVNATRWTQTGTIAGT
ncbi:MAG TPA: hypothetical protein VHV10_13920, partial [Ktedonobacteraceae bacterium]|nr:hypothetical protein [Ktedonobacteraceae bacterium]